MHYPYIAERQRRKHHDSYHSYRRGHRQGILQVF